MTAFMRWLLNRDGNRDEKSNSFALFIICLPIIIGAFGLGVDIARNVYVRQTMQSNLDLSVYSSLGNAHTDGSGNLVLDDPATVLASAEGLYAMNRADGPGLGCTNSGTVRLPTGQIVTKCWTTTRTVVTSTTVCYWAVEKSRNAFLPVLSKDLLYQTYDLSSGATIARDRSVSCN
jgi:hypothetical protein